MNSRAEDYFINSEFRYKVDDSSGSLICQTMNIYHTDVIVFFKAGPIVMFAIFLEATQNFLLLFHRPPLCSISTYITQTLFFSDLIADSHLPIYYVGYTRDFDGQSYGYERAYVATYHSLETSLGFLSVPAIPHVSDPFTFDIVT